MQLDLASDVLWGRLSPTSLYYGHYNILRAYTRTLLPYRIPGELQHGWTQHVIARNGVKAEDGTQHWVWNRYDIETKRLAGAYNVTPIGAPFLYLPPSPKPDVADKSLILFLLHGWEAEQVESVETSYANFLEKNAAVLKEFKRITMCLYWVENTNEKLKSFLTNKGVNVTTLGFRDWNPNYLLNYRHTVNNHEYVASNAFSTALFYALAMGKKTFVLPSDFRVNHLQTGFTFADYPKRYPELLFENFKDAPLPEIGELELGLEFKRSPEELRSLFGWNPGPFIARSAIGVGRYYSRQAIEIVREEALSGLRKIRK